LPALTPLPAVADIVPAGSSRGGQVLAHDPVHVIVPPDSDARSYRVNPFPSTSTVPTPGTELVPIVTDPAWAPEPLLPPELAGAVFPQAARTSAAAETIQSSRILPRDVFTVAPPSESCLGNPALRDPNEGIRPYLGSTDELRPKMTGMIPNFIFFS